MFIVKWPTSCNPPLVSIIDFFIYFLLWYDSEKQTGKVLNIGLELVTPAMQRVIYKMVNNSNIAIFSYLSVK